MKSGLRVVVVVPRAPNTLFLDPFQGPSELDLQMVIRSSGDA